MTFKTPLIPANAGTQMHSRTPAELARNHICAEPYDLGPGIRRDERSKRDVETFN